MWRCRSPWLRLLHQLACGRRARQGHVRRPVHGTDGRRRHGERNQPAGNGPPGAGRCRLSASAATVHHRGLTQEAECRGDAAFQRSPIRLNSWLTRGMIQNSPRLAGLPLPPFRGTTMARTVSSTRRLGQSLAIAALAAALGGAAGLSPVAVPQAQARSAVDVSDLAERVIDAVVNIFDLDPGRHGCSASPRRSSARRSRWTGTRRPESPRPRRPV